MSERKSSEEEAKRIAVQIAKFATDDDMAATKASWAMATPEQRPSVIYWLAKLPAAIGEQAGIDTKKTLETILLIWAKHEKPQGKDKETR